jgi:integrase/recombinase XerD
MTHLSIKPLANWSAHNQRFYEDFCQWLRDGGYRDSTVYLYGRAARLALGWLDKDFRLVDPQADLESVCRAIATHYDSEATCQTYFKGLAKLAEYLRFRCAWPTPEKQINWGYYLDALPGWLASDARAYVFHRQRNWLPEERYRATCTLLSHLSLSLRWMADHTELASIGDLTPALWLDYVDARLEASIRPATLNRELRDFQHFLRFLAEEGRAIWPCMVHLEPLKTGRSLPRDVPVDQLRQLLRQVEAEVASAPVAHCRQALLDRAWCFLMLYSGLRAGEVRPLRLADLDLEARRVRIEQSKGPKDRMVCLSAETVDALRAYLVMRGPARSEHVFLYRHRPLNPSYCGKRLRAFGSRCGMHVTPHQLRASFATLMLNAGASVLTVQALLGHQHVDTTLRYARVYDGTVAADYRRAIGETEQRLGVKRGAATPLPDSGCRQARRYAALWPSDNSAMNASQARQVSSLGGLSSHPV